MRVLIAQQAPASVPSVSRAVISVRLTALAVGALLTGCSSFTLEMPLMFADPGKYVFHDCDMLNTAAKSTTARIQDLKTLMAKADQGGVGGTLVGTAAYRTDYIAANEDMRVIEETARSKNCVTPSTWQSNGVIR